MSLPEPSALSDALGYADRWLGFRQEVLRVPGVQAAVLIGGEVALSTAHGHADVDDAIPLTTRHLFRIASHSKTFTATAVLQLVERGALRLDDRVGELLPRLAGTAVADRTVRALLSHASGLTRDGIDADHWQLWRPFPDTDRLFALAAEPSAVVLGAEERFKYSNVGFALLGAVVAAVSGRPYNTYVREEIVDRLGLGDTGPEYDPARAHDYATGYSALAYLPHRLPIDHVDTDAMSAATGFYGTAADLVRYAAAHFAGDERLLGDASRRLAQHEQWKVEGAGHYGLGFTVEAVGGRRLVGHNGGFPGHITRTVFDPVDSLAVSVFTNASDGPAGALADGLIRLIDLAGRPAPATLPAPPAGTDPRRFAGRFASLSGVADIVVLGTRVYVIDPSAAEPVSSTPTELGIVDETTLTVVESGGYGSPGETVHFTFDAAGTSVRRIRGARHETLMPLEEFRATLVSAPRVQLPRN